jgi:hypothetical protein
VANLSFPIFVIEDYVGSQSLELIVEKLDWDWLVVWQVLSESEQISSFF